MAHDILENSGFSADRKLKIVGTNPIKHDGWDKVTGAAKFSSDIVLPGMLVGKVLRSPHPHAIIPAPAAEGSPQFAYAADLGADAIFAYRLDAAAGRLVANDPPLVKTKPGAGPRHLAFHPDGRRLYAINELDNTVATYDFHSATGRLVERQVISTLPPDFKGKAYTADLKITPDGRFLYGTNRGHDSIAAYEIGPDGFLTLIEIVPSRGRGPQNLAITPDGSLLLCANMPGDNLAVFRVDRETGKLAAIGEPATVKTPSCIAVVPGE